MICFMKNFIIILIVFMAFLFDTLICFMFYYGINDNFIYAYMNSSSAACVLFGLFNLINLYEIKYENR